MSRRYNAQGSRFDLAARIHVAIRPTFIGLTAIALFGLSTPSAAQSAAPSESSAAETPSAVPKERTAPRSAVPRPTRAIRQPMTAQNAPRPAAAPPPQVAAQPASPQNSSAQPAAAPNGSTFQVDQQLQAAGVKTCL